MNDDQIRKIGFPDLGSCAVEHRRLEFFGAMLQEIAAQMAEQSHIMECILVEIQRSSR